MGIGLGLGILGMGMGILGLGMGIFTCTADASLA
jgi:hypothetical protein